MSAFDEAMRHARDAQALRSKPEGLDDATWLELIELSNADPYVCDYLRMQLYSEPGRPKAIELLGRLALALSKSRAHILEQAIEVVMNRPLPPMLVPVKE